MIFKKFFLVYCITMIRGYTGDLIIRHTFIVNHIISVTTIYRHANLMSRFYHIIGLVTTVVLYTLKANWTAITYSLNKYFSFNR